MAERRMFSKKIIDSDPFLDMPATARLLYYDLSMRADDDGFVNSPRKIIRMTGASEDDLRVLIAKQYVIPFESGVVVIKHWKIHNYIQSDRYKETMYLDEKALLSVTETKAYEIKENSCIQTGSEMDTACIRNGNSLDTKDYDKMKSEVYKMPENPCNFSVSNLDTECIQDGYRSDTQVRLDKNRIDKDSIDKKEGVDASEDEKTKKKTKEEKIYYPLDEKLNQTVLDFIAFRKTIKAPMTDKAVELMIGKLDSMTADNNEKIRILEQSILNGWKGIFPLQSVSVGSGSQKKEKGFYEMAQEYAEEEGDDLF